MASQRFILMACSAPAVAFFVAFWMLPAVTLLALPGSQGISAYFIVFTDSIYFKILWQTLLLSMVVTFATLGLGALTGVALARAQFVGKTLLLSLLTLPLSFAGVIIGFYIILLGGRQGVVAWIVQGMGGERVTFAYSFIGLFLGYLYFSLPRAISSYTAAAESLDGALEEAARSLGASRLNVVKDVWWPQLMSTTIATGGIVFATAVGAFGTAFTLSSHFEVLPITIYNEFTNYANFALAAALSITLGLVTWGVLWLARKLAGSTAEGI